MTFSLLMSVYEKDNCWQLSQSLSSIWDDQTLKPSQIVLVKDGEVGSELVKVIDIWNDRLGEVMTVISLSQNVGLGEALNEGLKYCKHELVTRMDSDDVALPSRFEKQVAFMMENPHVAASSGQIYEFDEKMSRCVGRRLVPTSPEELEKFAKRRSPLNHPATIFRKSIVEEVGKYPPLRNAQDYGLWSLILMRGHSLANLPDVLLHMRMGKSFVSRRGIAHLKSEIALLKFQRRIGFLSLSDFYINCTIKCVLRVAPRPIKRVAYRFGRP